MANLDVDDISSYGPETITILENIYGTYTYAVHNYSNRRASCISTKTRLTMTFIVTV